MTEASSTIDDPHLILDRMASIVEDDMLMRLSYIEDKISRPDLAESGAVCGGHRACAIGALWIAGGLSPADADIDSGVVDRYGLPRDIFEGAFRSIYLADKPALKQAHDALNAAAATYADERDIRLGGGWFSTIEDLFESGRHRDSDEQIDPRELLAVIDLARPLLDA